MGWQDAPEVQEEAAPSGQAWMSAPEADAQDAPDGNPPTETGSGGGISPMRYALPPAVAEGGAELLHTPNMIASLALKGLSQIPGMENVFGLKELSARLERNGYMDMAKKAGLVDPNRAKSPAQNVVDMAIKTAMQGGKNVVMNAISGTVAGATKEATGSDLLAGIMGMATPFAGRTAVNAAQSSKKINLNQTEQETFKTGRKYGLVAEPSIVRGPASIRESIAGKGALAQETSLHNQPIFNNMAAKYIGLPEGTPLTPKVFKAYKDTIAKPFEEVDQVFNKLKQNNQLPYFPRYHSASLMDEYREAGDHARSLWRAYSESPVKDIAMLKAAKAADATRDAVFKDIEMVAKTAGDPKLVDRLNYAKKMYARISDVQTATNVGSGNINAEAIGRMLQDGKPFEGELRDMGQFARAFGRSSKPKEVVPPPGVSGGDMAMGPVIAAAAGDVKSGALALGIPLLRGGQRRHLLSEKYQEMLLKQPSRFTTTIPKSSSLASSLITGKTVYENREASE